MSCPLQEALLEAIEMCLPQPLEQNRHASHAPSVRPAEIKLVTA